MPHWDLDAPAKLEFDDVVTGDVAAQTVSGVLEAQSADGAVKFGSVSGELTLAGGALRRLGMRSTTGPVRCEFGSLRAAMTPASHSVSGNLGAGSGNVSVTTVSGAVTVLRRPPHAAPHAGAEMESETR